MQSTMPFLILALGLITTLGVVYIVTAMLNSKRRVELESERIQSDLRVYVRMIDRHSLVSITDTGGTIIEVNEKFVAISGYSREELIGVNHRIINSGIHDRDFWKNFWSVLSQGQVWQGEICNRAKSGALYWVHSTIIPQLDEKGKIKRYFSIRTDITAQKENHRALLESRDRFASLVENIPGATYRCKNDPAWTVMYMSSQIEQLSGYPVSDFIENSVRTFESVIHPEDSGKVAREIAQAIEQGEAWEIGYRVLHRTGEIRFVHERGNLVRDERGEIAYLEGFVLDISREKKAQTQVKTQQQMLEVVSELGRIGAWEVNLVDGALIWSSMTKVLHEVPPDYKPDLNSAIHFYKEGESRETISRLIEAAIAKGTSFNEELILVTAKGREVWVAVEGHAEFKAGKCVRIYGLFQDIDARKTSEIALLHSKAEIDKFFSLSLNFLAIANTQGFFEKINPTFSRVMGYDEAYLLSIPFLELIHPDDLAETLHEVEGLAQGKLTFSFKNRYRCNNGTYITLLWHAASDVAAGKLYAVATDITQQVLLEQELRDAKANAESATRTKGEFLANMSHEIRTPVNGVLGMLDLLKLGELTVDQRSRVEIASESADSLLAIINDILDLSKVDAGKMSLESHNFDVKQIFIDVMASQSHKAEEKGLALKFDSQGFPNTWVLGDSGRLRQILINLVSNAIKFTEKGEVVLAPTMEAVDGRVRLQVEVRDTGIGIAEKDIQKMFKEFSQADASTTRKYGGTGLGLAISQKLCKLMEGDISVSSEPNKGSCFRFWIYVVQGKEQESPQKIAPATPVHWPENVRILLVEDNSVNQIVARQMLKLIGLSADIAANGLEAIELLRNAPASSPFTLVLMDCLMPEMDGFETTRRIRAGKAGERYRDTPILALTANAMQGDREACMEAGMTDYLAKPLKKESLLLIIQSLLSPAVFRNSDSDDGPRRREASQAGD